MDVTRDVVVLGGAIDLKLGTVKRTTSVFIPFPKLEVVPRPSPNPHTSALDDLSPH